MKKIFIDVASGVREYRRGLNVMLSFVRPGEIILFYTKGKINAYEIKYSPSRKVIFTKSFTEKYHPENTFVVNKDNFWEFL